MDTLQLIVWRDSVCAGDDVYAPHELLLEVSTDTLQSVAEQLLGDYLAGLLEGGTTWILLAGNYQGRPLTVLAQQWLQPRFLVEPDTSVQELVQRDAEPHLYLQHVSRVDPDRVLDYLKHVGQLPDYFTLRDMLKNDEEPPEAPKQRKWWQFWK